LHYSAVPEERVQYASGDSTIIKKMLFAKLRCSLNFNVSAWTDSGQRNRIFTLSVDYNARIFLKNPVSEHPCVSPMYDV